jgi:hypothetical protein
MRTVIVSMIGADRQVHTHSAEASSLFDACRKAVQYWSRFWFYEPNALLTVRAGEQCWHVRQDALRKAS